MHLPTPRRLGRLAVPAAALVAAVCAATVPSASVAPVASATPQNKAFLEHAAPVVGGPGKESDEILTSRESVVQARLAPTGTLADGQLSASLAQLSKLPTTAALWKEVTTLPYDEDDPDYRDPSYSNSSGGAGYSAGRVTGLAAFTDAGTTYLFAGGANGGVFRKTFAAGDTTGSAWAPISDQVLSLSTGDLVYDGSSLWLATGEANTGATSYVGSGVYRLTDPKTGVFTQSSRVGGTELEGRGINQLKIDEKRHLAYAATTRGLYRHSTDPATASTAWDRVFLPNASADGDVTQPYKNIVNDVAVDPRNGAVLANAAWRSGDVSYNGFYRSPDGSGTGTGEFQQVNPRGALGTTDVGNAEFAFSQDGSRLYALVESPNKLNRSPQTVLGGVFVSPSGSLDGPWNRIADSGKLAASGSAFQGADGNGYRPGIQAWYNNFIQVDPADSQHVYLGLEEVYESTDGGSSWTTPGPYWNFSFPCWDIRATSPQGGCPETTHSDQHSIAIAGGRVFVGNDGGVKSRPLSPAASREDASGHATDWTSLNRGLGTLQYYSVGVGADPAKAGTYAVSGGLQDNGASLIRGNDPSRMVSPFGGDGGDIVVNPKNGCQILDEYVYLTLWVTRNCGQTDGSTSAAFDVSVPDTNPRFTAPFRAVRGSVNTRDGSSERWVAGGNSVWTHDLAFSYTPQEAATDPVRGWRALTSLPATTEQTVGLDAFARVPGDPSRDIVYAAWCGTRNCNSVDFTRGLRTNAQGSWQEVSMRVSGTDAAGAELPNRYPNAVYVDNAADPSGKTFYLVFNGYNRRFIEGPGAAQDHVWKGVLTGTNADGTARVTWTNLSAGMPDLPATDVLVVGSNLVVGTDYAVLVRPLAGGGWTRVGARSGTAGALPLTTVFDLSAAPDGSLYAATHGRGLWKVPLSAVSGTTTTSGGGGKKG